MKQTILTLILILTVTFFTGCTMKSNEIKLGAFIQGNQTTFRLLAPKAERVYLVIFETLDAETGVEHPMHHVGKGIWSVTLDGAGMGTLYGYRLEGDYPGNDPEIIVADPYSKAAVTQNSYRHVAKSLIVNTSYDWENDTWIQIDPRDLIIYELHIRDMTAHPSAGCPEPGTYLGLIDPDQRGGITHLKEMGINAVQIMPAMDFANVEVPYLDPTTPVYNTWNPYARNHWGYMTTFFFAPESYYATNGTMEPNAWNGASGKAVTEFKDMVKTFHREGIAVIMDVVYNHVSNYDYHPFKYIDKGMYFRLDDKGEYIAQSGCGNDTRTEHPAVRNLILESVKYWMKEYHVDGFRFDLGNLIDSKTRQKIIKELKSINPHAIIIAEPWGGGYDPDGFSDMGWASFNDKFRNGVKGKNPNDGLGFIFGNWQGKNNQKILQRFVMGSLEKLGGQYEDISHNINYVECHDDLTLGDFIRLGSGIVKEDNIVTDCKINAHVTGRQLALNKLAALFLFTSQGITFIHQGQEWGRSKVIAETEAPDADVGKIDHNSYEKDNKTNWLNWDEKEINVELVEYYKGLIQLRKNYPEFCYSDPEDFHFFNLGKRVAVAYELQDKFLVALNGEAEVAMTMKLPDGKWQILADGESVNLEGKKTIQNNISVRPTSGVVLKKL
ncbi:MAG: pullulanase [Candidatus Marinimicrobia bacterium]|nr:pullulanase [Candidatus Neomarinimicrobiota bacterium]